jgi:hypothetical protein
MADVTPIRPNLSVPAPKKKLARNRDASSIKKRMEDDLRDARDYRDALVMSAICAAIRMLDADDMKDLAADVLRLARDRFEAAPEATHA